jgi:CRISPR-associated protein Cmr4
MTSRILYLFTRTPLHVGAGASVGAIDQPVQRERHTGFPIIPATSLKGSFADQWPTELFDANGVPIRITTRKEKQGEKERPVADCVSDAAWLFGSDTTDLPFAGSLIFSEARILAFPIRSARGSYAWITCPLMLQRAARDGVIAIEIPNEPKDNEAIFKSEGPLAIDNEIVLEEYCFSRSDTYPTELAKALAGLVDDELFRSINDRLVVLSNGMMSHFASTACEVAQHVRIDDTTGTADGGGLFNQENVPSDTLFYSRIGATKSRVPNGAFKGRSEKDALRAFATKVAEEKVFQFGGNASTGLGFCSATTNIFVNEA